MANINDDHLNADDTTISDGSGATPDDGIMVTILLFDFCLKKTFQQC